MKALIGFIFALLSLSAHAITFFTPDKLHNPPANLVVRYGFTGGTMDVYILPGNVCDQGRHHIVYDGQITEDTVKVLQHALKKFYAFEPTCVKNGEATQFDILTIQSPGGLMIAGAAFAELVKISKVEVRVPSLCASACTMIFLAGQQNRWMAPDARLGFHAPYTESNGKITCASHMDAKPMFENYVEGTNKRVGTYLYNEAMRKCGPQSMVWLTQAKAAQLGILRY